MKTLAITIVMLSLSYISFGQVGIGNTDPKATLDISATNATSPANTDGILIPKVDDFPITNPGSDQDGMMLFATGNGTPTKGFYYWDNTVTSWISFGNVEDQDWLEIGTSNAPNSNSDNIFTQGAVAIGSTSNASYKLNVIGDITDITSIHRNSLSGINSGFGYTIMTNQSTITGNGSITGIRNNLAVSDGISKFGTENQFGTGNGSETGVYNFFGNINSSEKTGMLNNFLGNFSGNAKGVFNNYSGPYTHTGNLYGIENNFNLEVTGDIIGLYNNLDFADGTGSKYGVYTIIRSTQDGTHYGIYNDVQKPSSYAGYFIGRMSFGNSITNRYLMPGSDGTNGQVMTSDGAGNITFQNPTTGVEQINDLIDGKSDNDGSDNGSSIFLGNSAGQNDDSSDNQNVGIGYQVLSANTSGTSNTALGYQAGMSNTTGFANIALGYTALQNNATASFLTALGYQALNSQTAGSGNIGVGYRTLFTTTNSNDNVGIGTRSLELNTTGSNNVSVGGLALVNNTTGDFNSAIGRDALLDNQSGNFNTALGYQAGYSNTGSRNVFLGNNAGYNQGNIDNKLYIENSDATPDSALIYGEFGTDSSTSGHILRTNSEFQIGNPALSGYAFPIIDGTTNQIMATDGSGQIDFIDAASLISDTDTQNTLDQSYDEGGAGVGRIINVDSGSLEILGNGANDFTTIITNTNGKSGIELNTSGNIVTGPGNTQQGIEINNSVNTNDSFANNYGVFARMTVNGTAINGTNAGFRSWFLPSGNAQGTQYGFYSSNQNSGNGTHYGFYNISNNSSDGTKFGLYNRITGSGTGNKYGVYSLIDSAAGGTQYGVYSSVSGSTNFAGFFYGRVSIGSDIANRYILPTTDGTNGQIMETDGSGNATWQNPNTGTDNQTIENFGLLGDTIGLAIEDDGQPVQTVDLSTLSFNVSNFALAKMTMSTNQIVPGSSATILNFDTTAFDIGSNFNTTTDRFEVTESGYYRITASFRSDAPNITTNFYQLYVGTGLVFKRDERDHHGSGYVMRFVQTIEYLTAGDNVVAYCFAEGGLTLSASAQYTTFEVERIR
jgi:hypothetical protein